MAALSGTTIPAGTLLRGHDISSVWHGEDNHVTTRPKPLIWRGGGGPPPCWNRSPALAIRNGDWKLLFNPLHMDRIELYNVSVHTFGRSVCKPSLLARIPHVDRHGGLAKHVSPEHTESV